MWGHPLECHTEEVILGRQSPTPMPMAALCCRCPPGFYLWSNHPCGLGAVPLETIWIWENKNSSSGHHPSFAPVLGLGTIYLLTLTSWKILGDSEWHHCPLWHVIHGFLDLKDDFPLGDYVIVGFHLLTNGLGAASFLSGLCCCSAGKHPDGIFFWAIPWFPCWVGRRSSSIIVCCRVEGGWWLVRTGWFRVKTPGRCLFRTSLS